MWIVAGIGNPGRRYSRTRHNIGFMVVEEVARRYEIDLKEKKGKYRMGRGSIGGEEVLLIEPLLYINMSGAVIKDIVDKYNIQPGKLLVIHDDLDMVTGKLRLKRKGSSGGHKGVESIIQSLSSKDFIRLKIGIGREEGVFAEDYVLSRFKKDEVSVMKKAIERASDVITSIMIEGFDKAMNVMSRKS